MNHPNGFTLQNGVAVSPDPFNALFGNDFFWHELIHMYVAGFMVTGFCFAGAYAWGWLRGRRGRYQRTALVIPLALAALAAPVEGVVGDWSARTVAQEQPLKLAEFEGLAQSTSGAPVHILGWYDGTSVVFGIEIPKLLSLLAFHDPGATVNGLNTAPQGGVPSLSVVNTVRLSFQAMVGIGLALGGLGAVFIVVWLRKRRLPRSPWFYRALVVSGPLSVVALISGWVVTEVGRQPWIVYKVMQTNDAVTGAQGVPVGYATLGIVYLALGGGVYWGLRRLARAPLDAAVPDAAG
jgi:cytochrome d ubiquinol oxidase subunit I